MRFVLLVALACFVIALLTSSASAFTVLGGSAASWVEGGFIAIVVDWLWWRDGGYWRPAARTPRPPA